MMTVADQKECNIQKLPKKFGSFVWYFLKDYKIPMGLFIFLTTAAGCWGPFNNLLIKELIDILPNLPQEETSALILPASLIILNFIIFDNLTWRGVEYISYKYQGIIKNSIIKRLFTNILDSSHEFFQENLSGRISNQITTLADNTETILHNIVPDFIRGLSLLVMSIVASLSANLTFGLIVAVWCACFTFISIFMSRRLIHLSDTQAKNESLISGQLVDAISNHSNIRIFSRKSFELKRIDSYLFSLLKAFRSKEGFVIILLSIQGAMIVGLMGFSIYSLLHYYKLGAVSIGDFALILGLSVHLGHMMWYTMWKVDSFNQAYGKCKQSLSALMVPLEVKDKPDAKPLQCNDGQISFNQVKFHYKGAEPLFEDKSIRIESGQKIGLVGYSGGGKSTFVNLILRLYDVIDGAILIDGQDIRDVSQDSLHENIAMIPQDPSLFHRSLTENIRYGQTYASDKEIIEAAKRAHAHEFISALPQKYDSLVGERGVKLSGGQRQRIAIARAILKNAPILILDEATSQLDSVTEALIQDSLWELMQNKTTIVIAHRLSTLLHMDRILVFDKGNIVEDGSHDKLLSKGSLYKQLWDTQVGGFLGDIENSER